MAENELEQWRERQRRRKLIEDWKAEAKAIQAADGEKRMLLRDAKRIALKRIEDTARTQADFEQLNQLWDNMQIVEDWRRDKQEGIAFGNLREYEISDVDVVIPEPDMVWWRQQMRGNFLDVIYDCPHEIGELTSGSPLYEYIKELDGHHKEILYYRVIRQWTAISIGVLRDQTDRNIRKVYNTMIEGVRRKLYLRLAPRYMAGLPLTTTQRQFCETYPEQLDETQRAKIMRKLAETERLAAKAGGSGEDE